MNIYLFDFFIITIKKIDNFLYLKHTINTISIMLYSSSQALSSDKEVKSPILSLIVCCDVNYGISKNGIIPWKFKCDSDYFADITSYTPRKQKNVLIVGKNTYLTMPE